MVGLGVYFKEDTGKRTFWEAVEYEGVKEEDSVHSCNLPEYLG